MDLKYWPSLAGWLFILIIVNHKKLSLISVRQMKGQWNLYNCTTSPTLWVLCRKHRHGFYFYNIIITFIFYLPEKTDLLDNSLTSSNGEWSCSRLYFFLKRCALHLHESLELEKSYFSFNLTVLDLMSQVATISTCLFIYLKNNNKNKAKSCITK